MPCTKINANDHRNKGYRVVETRTVVCGLGMDSNKDQDNQEKNERWQKTLGKYPVVKALLVYELGNGDDGTKDAPDNDIEEAVHATVEPAEDDGNGEPITHNLQGEKDIGVIFLTCSVKLVQSIEGHGHGIAGVGRRKAIFQGSGSRHCNAGKRGRERARETQHVLYEAGEEDACGEHVDGAGAGQWVNWGSRHDTYARPMLV